MRLYVNVKNAEELLWIHYSPSSKNMLEAYISNMA